MTEDEAKTTQCCGPEGCGYFNDLPRPARWCVGSACMAWRAQVPHPNDVVHVHTDPTDPSLGLMGFLRADAERHKWPIISDPIQPGSGFCGLAGAPA